MAVQSNFHVYSLGVVAANKKLDSDLAYIYPTEVTSFTEGELTAESFSAETGGVDREGNEYQLSVEENASLEAKWLPLGNTNRRTPPDVRRGERVLLWRNADTDQFYWTSMGLDDHLRKLETVVYSVSDTRDESKDSTHPDNSYSMEFCTHTKQVTLRTVKEDGEPFAYTFQFNAKDGGVVLTDDVGNYIELDSADTVIRLENRMGTHLYLDKKDILAFAPNEINMEASNRILFTCGSSTIEMTPSNIKQVSPRIDLN